MTASSLTPHQAEVCERLVALHHRARRPLYGYELGSFGALGKLVAKGYATLVTAAGPRHSTYEPTEKATTWAARRLAGR